MRRTALYSRSPSPAEPTPPAPEPDVPVPAHPASARRPRWRTAWRHPGVLWAAIVVLAASWVLGGGALQAPPRQLTQKDIDAAVMHTAQTKVLPSQAARAAAAVAPSVVRVEGEIEGRKNKRGQTELGRGIGTGVVIVDNGTILTNLHVVQGAERITVTFFDGTESPAGIVNIQPDNDLVQFEQGLDQMRTDETGATGHQPARRFGLQALLERFVKRIYRRHTVTP